MMNYNQLPPLSSAAKRALGLNTGGAVEDKAYTPEELARMKAEQAQQEQTEGLMDLSPEESNTWLADAETSEGRGQPLIGETGWNDVWDGLGGLFAPLKGQDAVEYSVSRAEKYKERLADIDQKIARGEGDPVALTKERESILHDLAKWQRKTAENEANADFIDTAEESIAAPIESVLTGVNKSYHWLMGTKGKLEQALENPNLSAEQRAEIEAKLADIDREVSLVEDTKTSEELGYKPVTQDEAGVIREADELGDTKIVDGVTHTVTEEGVVETPGEGETKTITENGKEVTQTWTIDENGDGSWVTDKPDEPDKKPDKKDPKTEKDLGDNQKNQLSGLAKTLGFESSEDITAFIGQYLLRRAMGMTHREAGSEAVNWLQSRADGREEDYQTRVGQRSDLSSSYTEESIEAYIESGDHKDLVGLPSGEIVLDHIRNEEPKELKVHGSQNSVSGWYYEGSWYTVAGGQLIPLGTSGVREWDNTRDSRENIEESYVSIGKGLQWDDNSGKGKKQRAIRNNVFSDDNIARYFNNFSAWAEQQQEKGLVIDLDSEEAKETFLLGLEMAGSRSGDSSDTLNNPSPYWDMAVLSTLSDDTRGAQDVMFKVEGDDETYISYDNMTNQRTNINAVITRAIQNGYTSEQAMSKVWSAWKALGPKGQQKWKNKVPRKSGNNAFNMWLQAEGHRIEFKKKTKKK